MFMMNKNDSSVGLQVYNWVDNWVYGRYIMIYRNISIVIDGFETGHHLVSLVVQGFSGEKKTWNMRITGFSIANG